MSKDSSIDISLLVLCHGEQREMVFFAPVSGREQEDALQLACRLEEAAPGQASMEACLDFVRQQLLIAGYSMLDK